MNPASYVVWCLEENAYAVYGVVAAFFFILTWKHKKYSNQRQASATDRRVLAGSSVGGGKESDDEDEDDDDEPGLSPTLSPELSSPEQSPAPHVPYRPPRRSDAELLGASAEFYRLMAARRTVRVFSPEPVPAEVLRNIVKTAGTAPSGAHTEPWTFVIVQDAATKAAIRVIVEEEEHLNYQSRMSRQWVADLRPLGTRPVKPYLTEAPALLLLFRRTHSRRAGGGKRLHYYSEASVAIAAGFLLAAIQYCGLVALTSTPLHCDARLRALLARPPGERLALLLPVGRPHAAATVPDLARKPFDQIAVEI